MTTGGGQADRARGGPGFGFALTAFCLLALLVWFPNDIRGGFVEQSPAGKPAPGDSFFPILLTGTMLVLGLVQVLRALAGRAGAPGGRIERANLVFLVRFLALVVAGLAVMAWTGPAAVWALGAAGLIEPAPYRAYADTAPIKHLGFVAGAVLISVVLIAWAEGGLRPRAPLAALLTVLALIVVFDLLLRNVPIPPNGDL